MANSNTATPPTPSSAVDEAVRITTQSARRTTENAQAAVAFGRRNLEQTTVLSRDLVALWTATVEASFKTAVEVQNAAFTTGQSMLDTTFGLTKDALARAADLTRQAQATALKTQEANTRLFKSLITDAKV